MGWKKLPKTNQSLALMGKFLGRKKLPSSRTAGFDNYFNHILKGYENPKQDRT